MASTLVYLRQGYLSFSRSFQQHLRSIARKVGRYHYQVRTMATTIEEPLQEELGLLKTVAVSRLMGPSDANVHGNVHGGTILKMIEEAGEIAATRYFNVVAKKMENFIPGTAVLVRVERTDFLQPMYIGEVAELTAEITFSSQHSMEVVVTVWAEDILKGKKRLTNKATLWYVPVGDKETNYKVLGVPSPADGIFDQKKWEKGRIAYEKQKIERANHKHRKVLRMRPSISEDDLDPQSVPYSQSSIIHPVGVGDVGAHGFVTGGTIMKLMDTCAGLVAIRHCKTNVVTASMDSTNFHKSVSLGSLLTLTGMCTFTSSRSMEIEVLVDAEYMRQGQQHKERAVTSFFTFVSLDANGQTQPIPHIKLSTAEENERFDSAKKRYEDRKLMRALSLSSVQNDKR